MPDEPADPIPAWAPNADPVWKSNADRLAAGARLLRDRAAPGDEHAARILELFGPVARFWADPVVAPFTMPFVPLMDAALGLVGALTEAATAPPAAQPNTKPVPESIEEPVAACVVCGCTEDKACAGGCAWIPNELQVDLCSMCAGAVSRALSAWLPF